MTPSHIALLNFVMKNYHLPDPIFVNEGIAIGLSYGYYNACNSHKDSTEYVLFVNCGADTVVFSLICFQRRQMSLIYTTNKQGCGSRYYSKAMFDLILDKVPELKEEVLHSSLLRLRFLEMAEKAKAGVGYYDAQTTDVAVSDCYDDSDDDIHVEISKEEYLKKCQNLGLLSLFEGAINDTIKVGLGRME